MTSSAITTAHLTRTFGSRYAVNDLNLTVRQGELFSLLGTNGAGKTTTIRMLSCLLQPTSGEVTVMGHRLSEDNQAIKRIIGVSPQEIAISGNLTTLENLVLMGRVFGMDRTSAKRRAYELMTLLELEDRTDLAKRLSGGLQRRLSIAMALVSNPLLLFLDEPTLGLDPHARKSVWNYIERLKGNKTILLTTHYLEEADALSDQLAIMNKGVIVAAGTAAELKQQHRKTPVFHVSATNLTEELIQQFVDCGYQATRTPDGLDIHAKETDLYALVDLLRSNQAAVTGIQLNQPSLDEVFLTVTGNESLPTNA